MILVIDNYDSYTYNVVQYLGELGASVEVVRNDVVNVEQVLAMGAEKIVMSPGPCTPNEAGICLALLKRQAGSIPILGICLGHQCIGQAWGGRVVRAARVMHGKTSMIHHDGKGIFRNLPQPFQATRYHSLVVAREEVPAELEISAWTEDAPGQPATIMGLRHSSLAVDGVQFHPESIMTLCGHDLLRNFLAASP